MNPQKRRPGTLVRAYAGRLLLLLGSLVLAFAGLEVFLRVYNPFGERIRGDTIVLPTNARRVITNSGFPRVDPQIVVTTNSLGFRGPDPPADFAAYLTMIAVGGSTTESLYVSDGKTWPDLLGRALSANLTQLWVNNAGLDGHSTFGHRLLLDQRIARLKPKVVVLLIGLNDVGREDLKAADAAVVAGGVHSGRLGALITWGARRSAIVATVLNLQRYREARKLDRVHRHLEIRWAPVLTPDRERSRALLQLHRERYVPPYAERVRDLVNRARAYGIEPVLMTQPALYGNVVDPETKVFLGTLEVDHEQGLHGALAWNLLELYNEAVRQVGVERGVLVVDLARRLPKDSRLFYDFVHFNNEGSAAVAAIAYDALCPFLASRFSDHKTADCPLPRESAP